MVSSRELNSSEEIVTRAYEVFPITLFSAEVYTAKGDLLKQP